MKQVVETLAGQRNGSSRLAAVTLKDLDAGNVLPIATDKQAGISKLGQGIIQGGSVTIPDDQAASVIPQNTGGIVFILGYNNEGAYPQPSYGAAYFDVGASIGMVAYGSLSSSFAVVNTDVTGTTGTDGNITLGRTTNELRIENRSGGNAEVFYFIMLGK